MDRDACIEAWIDKLSNREVLAIYFGQGGGPEVWILGEDELTQFAVDVIYAQGQIGPCSIAKIIRRVAEDALVTYFDTHTKECMERLEPREEGLSAAERNPSLLNQAGWGGLL